MPSGIPRALALLHPVIALLSLALLFHVASLGLRSRERHGALARITHARRAPWALWASALSAATGIVATWLWRPDLELAGGPHFWFGLSVVTLLALAALLSPRIPTSKAVRQIHPMLGLTALLIGLLQVFFGMRMLPF